ncbi:MAG: multicopper oxidase domain-containing protein [Candidatus Brocadia sp.]
MKALKLMGWMTAIMLAGITTYTAMPGVFGEEAKQTTVWSLSEEEQDLINVTNGDLLGERGPDGVWEFHLYTTDGYVEMTNGELVWVMGYTHAKGSFKNVGEVTTKEQVEELLEPVKVPGDPLHLFVGEKARITLHNTGIHYAAEHSGINHVAHTIHFHGLDLTPAVDGVPSLPVDPVLEHKAFTYELTPQYEGSYMGHCHVDSFNHILAGMYFPIIIHQDRMKTAYGYKYDRDYTLFFSELSSTANEQLQETGIVHGLQDWKADYFLINGRTFTDNLYHPRSVINDPRSRIVAYEDETVLLRLMALGADHVFAIHPHGYHMEVIALDGRKLKSSYEKDTLCIASGERIDVLVKIPHFASQRKCLSCNLGAGITIMHDHNLRGMVSSGKYPMGALTIFDVRPRAKVAKPDEPLIKGGKPYNPLEH